MAGTVGAGACAAALAASVAACTPAGSPPGAGSPFATVPPGPGTTAARAPGMPPTHTAGGGTRSSRHAGFGRTGRGRVRAAVPSRSALADPDAIAAAGSDVWVANSDYLNGGRGWVSEFSADTGALIRVVEGPAYRLNGPDAIAANQGDVWVVNVDGATVT